MFSSSRVAFLIGFAGGSAVTLIGLVAWGAHLDRVTRSRGATPLLSPIKYVTSIVQLQKSANNMRAHLRAAWVPETSSLSHDTWQLRTPGEQSVRLAHLKGRVVFLNFWSTTCAPCIAELPGIERLRASLKNEPVDFMAVALEPQDRVRQFLSTMPFDLPVYLSDGSLPRNLEPTPFPTTYILNRDGLAVVKEIGAVNWDTEPARAFIRALAGQ